MRKYMEHVNGKIKALEAEIPKLRKAKDTAGVKVAEAKLALYIALWDDEPVAKNLIIGHLQYREYGLMKEIVATLKKGKNIQGKMAARTLLKIQPLAETAHMIQQEFKKLGADSSGALLRSANPARVKGFGSYLALKG